MMRKFGLIAVIAVVAAAAAGAQTLQDGFFFAQDDRFSSDGWRNQVVLEVKGGKITSANWNGTNIIPGVQDRKGYAASNSAAADWASQAQKAEQYLVGNQNINFNQYNDQGVTTAISGVTIPVKPFFDLVRKAASSNPVPKGIYNKDGWYFGIAPDFDPFGTKDTALITVVNGTIVDAIWNGVFRDANKSSKIVESNSGRYNMVRLGKARSEWHVQAAVGGAALVRAQDPTRIPVKADKKTDAVSGVSIMMKDFLDTANRALQPAR
ncbi:hypothetical protein [Breznakiella homolactica]|uniref:Uncharacterized protein n=1 Tax=Breznakiella homolactica TaxID=2798577 RepID=A0A7T7XPG3_9SPIR|nr:hypothetical protein [Breznakiella homolactica]QQO10047.1 hypothetical protein JFL75_03785 [Breznakiella homolactica]